MGIRVHILNMKKYFLFLSLLLFCQVARADIWILVDGKTNDVKGKSISPMISSNTNYFCIPASVSDLRLLDKIDEVTYNKNSNRIQPKPAIEIANLNLRKSNEQKIASLISLYIISNAINSALSNTTDPNLISLFNAKLSEITNQINLLSR